MAVESFKANRSGPMGNKTNLLPLLRRLDRGRVILDLQEGIAKIVQAIEDNRGAGSGELSLKLKVKCEAEGTYTLEPSVTVKVPQPKRLKTTTFLNEETGELEDRDPRQPDLPSVVEADFRNGTRSPGGDE